MTAPRTQSLIESYLARLHAAAAELPDDRRAELVEGITEHLASARAAGATADDAAIEGLLERLGDPREIVAAAWDTHDVGATRPARLTWQRWKNQPGTSLEGNALLLMTLGSIFLAWPVGVWLMWQSRRWTRAEKVLGTVGVPGGPMAALYLPLILPERTCRSSSGFSAGGGPDALPAVECKAGVPHSVSSSLSITMFVIALLVAAYLWRRAKRDARTGPHPSEQHTPRPEPSWGGLEIAVIALFGPGALLLYGIGPLVGLVLLNISSQWSRPEKRLARIFVVFAVLSTLGTGLMLLRLVDNGGGPWLSRLAYFSPVITSIAAAAYLYLSLKRRTNRPLADLG